MSEKELNEETDEQTSTVTEDDFEQAQDKARLSLNKILGVADSIKHQIEDTMLSIIPAEVTEHLVKAQKELIAAGQRVGDIAREKLDEKVARAKNLHEEMKRDKEEKNSENDE
jgi:uncharacterized protein YicC (UPF0701 family)